MQDRANPDPSQAPLADPTALAKFGRLEVVARLLVEGMTVGQHMSPYKGSSVEFVEHRQYAPGDEMRHIDWRALGKTGKYYVKEFEDETNLQCHLLVDASGSMAYCGATLSKFDYCRYLAVALGYLLLRQRDAVGLMTFDTAIRDLAQPSAHPNNFQQLTALLENRRPGGETSLGQVCERLLQHIKRRSLVVLLSDCFDDLDGLTATLKRFRHARHELIVFQVVTPEEESFPFRRPTQFRSLEQADHRQLVDPPQLRAHYLERYRAFCDDLAQRCAGLGIDYQKLVTDEPYHTALGAFLDARSHRKRKRK